MSDSLRGCTSLEYAGIDDEPKTTRFMVPVLLFFDVAIEEGDTPKEIRDRAVSIIESRLGSIGAESNEVELKGFGDDEARIYPSDHKWCNTFKHMEMNLDPEWQCDNPRCKAVYFGAGDGYDGLCPNCADRAEKRRKWKS